MKIKDFLNEISDVLGREPDSVTLDDTPDTIEEWDSVGHLSIISVVDEQLGVPVNTPEMREFDSIRKLVTLLVDQNELEA